MAVTTGFSTSRRANARAAALATKQKRQKVFIAIGLVIFLLILAFEVPKTLKLMNGSSPASTSAPEIAASGTPSTQPALAPVQSTAAWRALRKQAAHDPFLSTASGAQAPGFDAVSTPSNLHDPFAGSSSDSTVASAGSSAPSADLSDSQPKTIVVGTPGSGRAATTGWIVILASIPSQQGRSTANAFAKKAGGRGLGSVSILNSSTAKPLRGGYWVVYTGPFPTLAAVTKNADSAHTSGYGNAYIRQLIVYGKKS